LVKEKSELETKISGLENIVEDEFFSDLIRRSFCGFDLHLKGNKEDIQTFTDSAAKLGNLTTVGSRPKKDFHVVNLTYSDTVSKDDVEMLIEELGLEALTVQAVRGFTF